MPMPAAQFVPAPAFPKLRHALRSLFLRVDQMGTAIALGEAGDLDGAQALREKHAKSQA